MPLVRWLRGMSDESDGLYAGCGVGLCARESLSRRSPSGLSQDLLGLRIEREELVLRPCLGCFLSYKERTEVDKSLYLVKNNSCSQPDLIWCGVSRSLDVHFLSSDALDSFSDPYFVTLCHVRHSALIYALPLSGTETNSSPDQFIAIGFPFTSSHILPLRGGVAQRWGLRALGGERRASPA